LLWLLLIPACFYAAFLSLSKAAMLMAILNLIFYILFNFFNFHSLKLSSKFISIISITLIGFSSFYIYNNFEKLVGGLTYEQAGRIIDAVQIGQGKINDKTTSERSGIAELVFPMIEAHPLEGNGFGSFHRIVSHGLGVHNTALLIIGESGIIPLILYLVFILVFILKSLKQKEIGLKYLYIAVLITFILISFLTSHNALDERISNVILGIFLVLINIRK
jgi:hypothetical protein